jgi:hypothetical protein
VGNSLIKLRDIPMTRFLILNKFQPSSEVGRKLEEVKNLREAILLRPELVWSTYPNNMDFTYKFESPYKNYCYIATEVICKIFPDAIPYKMNDPLHYFSKLNEEIIDPTYDQFEYALNYDLGKKTKFKQFSKRAKELHKTYLEVSNRNKLMVIQSSGEDGRRKI